MQAFLTFVLYTETTEIRKYHVSYCILYKLIYLSISLCRGPKFSFNSTDDFWHYALRKRPRPIPKTKT